MIEMIRYKNNPVLRPQDIPADCFAVYNGGAAKINGEYILMVRVEDMARREYAWTARSKNGYDFVPDAEPVRFISEDMAFYNEYAGKSWYDPRINVVDGKYYITYAASGKHGCMVGIGKTEDFYTVEHVAFAHHPQNRNGVLFPEKINGMYALLHRPEADGGGSIWISYSPDLEFWGKSSVVAPRQTGLWNSVKVGAGSPPIKTRKGWLVITHAVCGSCAGHYYTMGAVLLDIDNPAQLIAYSDGAIMRPEADYEERGFVPNVLFPCGAIPEKDGSLKIFYGASDNYECLVETRMEHILDALKYL
jgi:predicted GH43/DUF377 family glycosyl hydrolase